MKSFLGAFVGVTALAFAGAAFAQTYQPMQPGPMPPPTQLQMSQPMMQPAPMQQPTYTSGALPPWMQDDHSSSTYPRPMPGDQSGDRLNARYRNGIMVPPGTGLPADPDQQ